MVVCTWKVADAPVPTVCTVPGSMPVLPRTVRPTCSVVIEVLAGNWIRVPPAKSMPKLKPRMTISAIETTTRTSETV